jgi:hypothetical protein
MQDHCGGTIMETIPLSEALPEEKDRLPLVEGTEFAISGIIIEEHTARDKKDPKVLKPFKVAKLNGFTLPNCEPFVKFKTSAIRVVKQCEDLLSNGSCFESGECKKPIRVRVWGYDGAQGRGLVLVDA